MHRADLSAIGNRTCALLRDFEYEKVQLLEFEEQRKNPHRCSGIGIHSDSGIFPWRRHQAPPPPSGILAEGSGAVVAMLSFLCERAPGLGVANSRYENSQPGKRRYPIRL